MRRSRKQSGRIVGSYQLRVYYEDTDAGGVVYYANYLRYFERARTEWFREYGGDLAALAGKDVHFVVVHADLSLKAPARYGDLLRVETFLEALRRTEFTLGYRVCRETKTLATGSTRMATVRLGEGETQPRVIPIPSEIRIILEKLFAPARDF